MTGFTKNRNFHLLDHPVISQRYFFPKRVKYAHPFWVDADGAQLACCYFEGHPGSRTIIHFHGNGETVADYRDDFVSIIDSMGYNSFLAEYRGYGMSTGKPSLFQMLSDVEAIIETLNQPDENLILFGRSLGSLYAIHAACIFPNIAGLIIESGIANPLERLLIRIDPRELGATAEEIAEAVHRDFNHKFKMDQYEGPTLILHTKYDGLVDVSHAHRLRAWAAGPTTLRIFERGDHNSILHVNSHEYFKSIDVFLREHGL